MFSVVLKKCALPRKLNHVVNASRHAPNQTVDCSLADLVPFFFKQILELQEILAGEKQSSHTALQKAPHVLNRIEVWRSGWPAQCTDGRLGFV